MPKEPTFDPKEVHRYYSANCFNEAWGFIDKAERTAEENEKMIQLAQASIWHWTQREDCTKLNMSIGYWQASRVYALAGEVDNARKYGQLSLDNAEEKEVFAKGYAYEALARSEAVAGNIAKRDEYISEAQKYADKIEKEDEKKYLVDDLKTIG